MNYVWIWLVAMLLSLGLGFLLGRALMLRKRRHMEQYVSEVMEQHLAEVQTMYSQVRGWRHDYRNHIQTMQAYVENAGIRCTSSVSARFNRYGNFDRSGY